MKGLPSHPLLIKFLDLLKELMSADGILLHLCGKEKLDLYRGNSSGLSEERKASFFQAIQLVLEKQKQQNVFFAILKPVLIIALLAVNMSTAIWYLGGSEQQDETNSRQELLEMLASDLKLDDEQNSGFIFE